MGVERNSHRIAIVVRKMGSNFVILVCISQVASLQCYICVPPKYKGTQSPPCEFDAHQWGTLETCPEDSQFCLTSVQNYQGTEVHVRECGKMDGGGISPEFKDDCVNEMTDKTQGYICYCKGDGCNKGLGHHNSATQSKLTLGLLGPVLLSYYLAK